MIDFPIDELWDDSSCTLWLEQHLRPKGLICPHCGHAERRLFRAQGHFPAYRCRACEGYYTLLTGTVFAKSRQRPATLVLLLQEIAKGGADSPPRPRVGALTQTASYPPAAYSGQHQ